MSEPINGSGPTPLTPVEPAADTESLGHYLATLLEARWFIALVTAAVLCSGLAHAFVTTRIYRSTALLQVEEKRKGIVGLEQLSASFAGPSDADTEIEIIRSRSLLAHVVEQLHLDLAASPRTFPLVGAAVARRYQGLEPAGAPLGLTSYAWGGERIRMDRLDVPEKLLGKPLTLVAGSEGRFQLLSEEGERVLEGQVGQAARGSHPSGAVEIFVSELRARTGTRFRAVRFDTDDVIDSLQRQLEIREKGRRTGILSLALEGSSPTRLAAILDGVSAAYLRQNVERRSEEARKTLEFVNSQLPTVKGNLNAAEVTLNEYRSQKGSVDLSLEAKGALDRIVDIEKALAEADVQYAEMRLRYTDQHPLVQALRRKQTRLQTEREAVNGQIRKLPGAEMESMRLMRDVKVGNELYELLLNKAQELRVLSEGTVGNVRILDRARLPKRAVRPRVVQTAALSLGLGLVLGIAGAFVRKALRRGVEDPDELERALGVAVYATVPHSERQVQIARSIARRQADVVALARADPADLAVESLRSLRTTLQFALTDAANNIIAIGGPSPGIGKSFVCTNLACVLADAGRHILIVDGDLRNGNLHRYFGGKRVPGLSEVISGAMSFEEALRHDAGGKLDFLASGTIPPNPSELLMSPRFQAMLAAASRDYDLVILDCPPILAVTDAAILARHAGVNLFVLRAGYHPLREVALATKRLTQNGLRLHGMIFNDVRRVAGGAYGQYGYAYQYTYGSSRRSRESGWKRIAGRSRPRS